MFNKVKKLFSSIFKDEESNDLLTDEVEELSPTEAEAPPVIDAKKKTVLVFDKKRRFFITKTKYSIVAVFCPVKKEFHIRKLDGSIQTIKFNPLNDNEFAYPIAGDWTGKGYDGIGIYYPKTGLALFKNELDNNNKADKSIEYATEGDYIPLAGNWQGDSIDSLGFYYTENSVFLFPEKEISVLRFGKKGENYIPLSGDWNNDGNETVGLYDPETSIFRVKNTLEGKAADYIFRFGKKIAGKEFLPLSGDWEGVGVDSIGIYEKNSGVFRLKNRLGAGKADIIFELGFKNLMPLAISIIE